MKFPAVFVISFFKPTIIIRDANLCQLIAGLPEVFCPGSWKQRRLAGRNPPVHIVQVIKGLTRHKRGFLLP